jgi:hypothetical protein
MANYFPIALTGTTMSWLMNLPEGTLHTWSELYHQSVFKATNNMAGYEALLFGLNTTLSLGV